MYGKWYKPASGLYILLFVINKKIINDEKQQKIKKFLVKYILLYFKIIKKLKNNNTEFKSWFKGKKKFKNKAKKEITINP